LLAYVHHFNKIRMDRQLAKEEAEAKEENLNFQTNTFGKDFLFHEDSGHNIIIEKEKPVKKDVSVQNPIKDSVKSDTSVEIEQAIENSLQKEFAETVNVIEDMPLENPIISEPIAETFEEIQPLPDFETDLQESFSEIVTNNIEEKIETDIDIPKLNEDDMLVNADINKTLQEEDSDYELEQYIDSIEFEDVVDKDFGKDILPEEVFGNVDDETELQKIAKLDINRKDDREVLKNNEEQNNFNANSKKTITIPNVGEYNIRPVKALELKGKKDQIETQEVIKEEPVKNSEKTDKDIIKGSFDLTPTKALYLVDYENSTILMAGIKDNYIVLKNFEKIIDKPFFVRQTEKTSKKANYIVKVGDFRGIVSVTLKNVELALEL